MRRRLSTVLSAVSLVLCVATCVMWARSYDRFEAAGWYLPPDAAGEQASYLAQSYPHALYLHAQIVRPPLADPAQPRLVAVSRRIGHAQALRDRRINEGDGTVRLLGFSYRARGGDAAGTYLITSASVPYWFLVAGLSVPPAGWARRRLRRRRRHRDGLCVTCGYDLRATPGRCPECGAVPEAARLN